MKQSKRTTHLTYSELKERVLLLREYGFIRAQGRKVFKKEMEASGIKKVVRFSVEDVFFYRGPFGNYLDFWEQRKKLEIQESAPKVKGDVFYAKVEVLKVHRDVPSRVKIGPHEYILNIKN